MLQSGIDRDALTVIIQAKYKIEGRKNALKGKVQAFSLTHTVRQARGINV